MAQNILHNAWSEKIAQCLEEDLDDSARKKKFGGRRNFNNTDNDSILTHTVHGTEGIVPSVNLSDETTFQRRSQTNRYLSTDEVEYDTRNFSIKHSPSSESVFSRGSRNFNRGSPPGSYRSSRNSILNAPLNKKEEQKDGVNIIMLVGFAIGIAFGTFFNIAEGYLKWTQLRITKIQLQIYGGKTIQDFYVQEESLGKKLLYSPVSGLFVLLQSIVYLVIMCVHFLQKPAPKKLVSNVMLRYINE